MSGGFVIKEWKPIGAGALVGVAQVELPSGLILSLGVFESHGKRWCAMSMVLTGRDGAPLRDDNGKPRYEQLLRWKDAATRDRFHRALFEAIDRMAGATANENSARHRSSARPKSSAVDHSVDHSQGLDDSGNLDDVEALQ